MSRRGTNIRKRADGRWEGRYYIVDTAGSKKCKSVYGHSYKEVTERLLTAKAASLNQTAAPKQSAITVKEVAEKWLESIASSRKCSTIQKYSTIYNKYIKPNWGESVIDQLNQNEILKLLPETAGESVIKSILCIFNSILAYGVATYGTGEIHLSYRSKRSSVTSSNNINTINTTDQQKLSIIWITIRLMEEIKHMDISAGIVIFNPDINRLKENISAVIVQCAHVYLVDNGSNNIDEVKKLLNQYNHSKVSVLCNMENQGIAKALNQLASEAQKGGFDWILTLDQDSVAPSNIIEEFEKYTNNLNTGMLCPVICDRNKGVVVEAKDNYKEIDECITSGSLLNIKAWRKIGGFDESMFIDGVDFDICYRLRKNGYKILCIQSVVLLHELGRIVYHRFIFWKVLVKNHSAFRKFYIARNTVYLARKEHTNIIKAILQNVKLFLIVVCYEDDKWKKSKKILQGTIDGFKCEIDR